MRHFLLTGFIFLGLALVATVAVFLLTRMYSLPTDIETLKEEARSAVTDTLQVVTSEKVEQVASSTLPALPEGGLPLSALSLEGAQKKAFEAAGINPDTFIITEAMLACARDAVGEARVAAFVAGESPSLLEIGRLLPCLGAS